MKKLKLITVVFLVAIVTVVLTVVPMLSANAVYYFDGAKMISSSGYKYYRAWSQDQFPWHNTKPSDAWESDWMNQYGCSTVAMAKMFVEAGVASPYSVTPGTLMSKYGSPSKGIGDIGIYWSTLAGQFNMTCESFQYYPNGSFYNTAMSFFNKTDKQYHLLLKVSLAGGGSHYVQVDRQATVDKGELIYNDSTNTQDGGTRFNTTKDYFDTVSLKRLSCANFTPEYFVVFSHKGSVKIKTLKEINSTTAELMWYPNGACQKYIVYRRNKGETSWTGKRIATISNKYAEGECTYRDTTLTMGKEYEYTVRGYYKVGSKAVYLNYSKTGKGITTHPDPPKMKSTTSINHYTIKVKWYSVSNADGYCVFRKAVGESTWTKLSDSVKATTFTDKTAVTGKTYYYTAGAYVNNSSFMGAYDKTGIKGVALPAKVTLDKAESVDFNKINVSWKKVSKVSGYVVYRKSSTDKGYKQIGEVTGSSNISFTDKSAVTGTKYTYNVRAFKIVNKVKYFGGINSSGIQGVAYTRAPVIKKISSNTYNKMKIMWEKVGGASGYIIYHKTEADKTYSKVGEVHGNIKTEFTDENLKCCVKYLYKVKGYKVVSGKKYKGFACEEKSGYTAPAQPGIKGAESINYKTIELNWTKVKGATGYTVYRKETGKYQSISEINNVNTLSYRDNEAITGVKYTYTIRAFCKANGMKKYSAYNNYIYGTAYPAKPEILGVDSVDYSTVKVRWKTVSGSDGYNIYRKSGKGKYKKIFTEKNSKSTTYTDTGRTCGETYTYSVKAYRIQNGKTFFGGYAKGVKGTAVPSAPEFNVEVESYDSLTISWDTVDGSDGYRVYYKNQGDKKWSVLATFDNPDLTSCMHKSLVTGKKYSYTVRAYRKNKAKVWGSYDKSGKTQIPLTTAPVLVSAKSVDYNNITVEWKGVQGAEGYTVYRKEDGDKKWKILERLDNKALRSYSDKNISCGNKYIYTVRSYRKVNSKVTNGYYDKSGIGVRSVPGKPQLSAVSYSYNKIKVVWNRCYGATGYKIYRKEDYGKFELLKRVGVQSTTSLIDNVECGVDYTYYVTAYVTVDKNDYNSSDSQESKCKAVPSAPQLVSVSSPEEKTAKITWGIISGCSGYYIYRKEAGGTYKIIEDEKSPTTRSFTDQNLESGVKYTYTVKAYKICNAGYIGGKYNKTGLSVIVK